MMWFRSCPKCGGDLSASADIYGSYIQCVQCGFLRDTPQQPVLLRRSAQPAPAPAFAQRRSA